MLSLLGKDMQTEVLFKQKLEIYREIKSTYNSTKPYVYNYQVNDNRKSRSLIRDVARKN